MIWGQTTCMTVGSSPSCSSGRSGAGGWPEQYPGNGATGCEFLLTAARPAVHVAPAVDVAVHVCVVHQDWVLMMQPCQANWAQRGREPGSSVHSGVGGGGPPDRLHARLW
jgi:hypothetical protein